jgi:hypothetical protein
MTYHQERLRTYRTQLYPWCIIRVLTNGHETELSRSPEALSKGKEARSIICFRRRSDAEAHLQILRVNNPTASYEIIFRITSEHSHLTTEQKQFQSYSALD